MTPAELRRARIAVLCYFFVLGAATATWAARLPAIKASLHLSDGGLGLALFAVPAGSVLTLALSGRIVDAFGAARVMRIAGLLVAAALVAIGLGPATGDLPVLIAALVWYGAVAGLLDVSMNTCGARLEVGYGRPIMSSLHAGYSPVPDQRGDEHGQVPGGRAEADGDERRGHEQSRDPRDARGAERVDDAAAQRQRQHAARGHGEQRQPQAAVAQVQRGLDGREPGRPGRRGRAEHEEGAEHRDPGPP